LTAPLLDRGDELTAPLLDTGGPSSSAPPSRDPSAPGTPSAPAPRAGDLAGAAPAPTDAAATPTTPIPETPLETALTGGPQPLETVPPAGSVAGHAHALYSLALPAGATPFVQTPAWSATMATANAPAPNGDGKPVAPTQPPAPFSGSAAAAVSGAAASALFALLISLAAFTLGGSSRLRLTPARWRPLAFVAVIERPG
jgi:hypothetical protein